MIHHLGRLYMGDLETLLRICRSNLMVGAKNALVQAELTRDRIQSGPLI